MRLKKMLAARIALVLLLLSAAFLVACSGSAAPAESEAPATKEAAFVPECPNGLINDQYPGLCGQYVDRDGDRVCDLSQ